MKNFKIKYLSLILLIIMQWSCSSTDVEDQTDENSINQEKYSEIFEMYNSFKLDGKLLTNKNEVIKILSNSMEVAHYVPEKKEVNFYTSEANFRKVNPKNLETEVTSNEENSQMERLSADLGQFGVNYQGVTNLGDVFDQAYYRNFALNSFIAIYPKSAYTTASGTWFYRLYTDSSLLNNTEILKVTSGTSVTTGTAEPAEWFKQINLGNYIGIIKNDNSRKLRYTFYALENNGGNSVYIDLAVDKYVKIATGKFNTLGTFKTPNSMTITAI